MRGPTPITAREAGPPSLRSAIIRVPNHYSDPARTT